MASSAKKIINQIEKAETELMENLEWLGVLEQAGFDANAQDARRRFEVQDGKLFERPKYTGGKISGRWRLKEHRQIWP